MNSTSFWVWVPAGPPCTAHPRYTRPVSTVDGAISTADVCGTTTAARDSRGNAEINWVGTVGSTKARVPRNAHLRARRKPEVSMGPQRQQTRTAIAARHPAGPVLGLPDSTLPLLSSVSWPIFSFLWYCFVTSSLVQLFLQILFSSWRACTLRPDS